MVSLVFFDILQLPHSVISNSEKLTHPNIQYILLIEGNSTYLSTSGKCVFYNCAFRSPFFTAILLPSGRRGGL